MSQTCANMSATSSTGPGFSSSAEFVAGTRDSLLFHSSPQSPWFFGHVGRYKLNRLALGTRMPSFWSVFLQLSSKDFPLLKTNIFKFPMTHETFLDGKS